MQMESYWNLGNEEEEIAASFAFSLVSDFTCSEVLKVVIDLQVFEIIKEHGPGACLSAAEIAAKLPTTNIEAAQSYLSRMLDILVSNSILTLSLGTVEKRYGLAPVCKFFMPNEDGVSFTPFMDTAFRNSVKDGFRTLKYAVLEGSVPFTKAFGMPYYEYLEKHPDIQIAFSKAMSDHSTLVMRGILKNYKGFEGLPSLVDVGGNTGTTLGMICSQYPQIKGINFDQPHIIADAPSYPGVEHVAGSMFVNIPKGDAMFLKWIFHAFTDDQCIKILKNCYAALPEDHGKVIVCEYLLPGPHEPTTNVFAKSVLQLNTIMMCMQEGKERSKVEYEALAFKAGFQSFQVVCSAYNVHVMEFLKKI
ncbi:caffeic acid 3-O-methyltransferase-like [Silene latifolia]|uniref:caffeic acid 3-O-methyltransferase-like n=1 Tax=Silene latifolia TaxID=37657 RepID=UPI003D78B2FC